MNTRQDQALRPTTHRRAFPFVPLLATFLFTILCLPAFSETKPPEEEGVFYQTVNGAYLKFKINNKEGLNMVDVLGFGPNTTFSGKLTIPASITYEGTQYSIRAIPKNSFKGTNITQLVVKRCWGIFSNAFTDCQSLTSVEVEEFFHYRWIAANPGEVEGLNSNTFKGCTSLTSVTIPQYCSNADDAYRVDDGPFRGCTALKNITVKEDPDRVITSGSYYYTIDGVLCKKYVGQNRDDLVCYPEGRTATTYNIPEGITILLGYSFYAQSNLQKVTIPEGVEMIDEHCFEKCTNLYQVKMPGTVTEIRQYAFSECSSLAAINLPVGLETISYSTFYRCSSLENIKLPIGLEIIGSYAFYGCTKLKSIKLPYSITNIYTYAFANCFLLTEVVAKNPSSPTCGADAFYNIQSQINLSVPEGSDYAQWEPWNKMNITEKPLIDLVDNFGIRIAGTEVNEANHTGDFLDGKAKFSFSGNQCTLELTDVDISTNGVAALDKYNNDLGTINYIFNGNNKLTTKNGSNVWQNKAMNTDITINGSLTVKAPNATRAMYTTYKTYIHGNGNLTLENNGTAMSIVGEGSSLTIDDLNISFTGSRYGIFCNSTPVGESIIYNGDITLNNVAGTITAGSGYESIAQNSSLTLNDCHITNGASYDPVEHEVASSKIVLEREGGTVTGVALPTGTNASTARSTMYDLTGRPVATPQPGHIYIVRGENGEARKVVVR